MSSLYVDGKKVVGNNALHVETTLLSGFGGTITWVVVNNICIVYMSISRSAAVGNLWTSLLAGVPNCPMGTVTSTIQHGTYVRVNNGTLEIYYPSLFPIYHTFCYPVDEAWHE